MIDVSPFWIIVISTYAGLFILFFIVLLVNNLIFKKFNILQHFPVEIMSEKSPTSLLLRIIQYACLFPAILPMILVSVYFDSFGGLLPIEIIIGAVVLFSACLNVVLSYIPARNTKPHQIIATIHMSISFLLASLVTFNGFYFMYLYNSQSTGSVYHMILGIVGALLALGMFAVIFNPKLLNWYRLDKETNDDGTISVTRPKIFPLAFSEWLSIAISFLSGLIFIFELVRF